MNDTARVALVYPYFRTRSPNELLFPPLGLAALASQLHGIGIEARIFDCTFSSFENLEQSLRSYQPGIVGIYSMVTMTRSAFRIAEMVRRLFPECLLVAGGPMPTLYPDNYAEQFDVVYRGEADLHFPRFCRDFLNLNSDRNRLNALPLQTYPGLYIWKKPINVDNRVVHFGEREISSFPLPQRNDFNHAMYQDAWRNYDGTRTTSILTTFGCPFQCDFCSKPIFGNIFRRKNLNGIFEEIRDIRDLGYDRLWIADDNFTMDAVFLSEFCRRMADNKLAWSCLSRVTGLDKDTVRMMKESGCRRVYLGLETGSSATLKLMNKQASLENGITAVRMFHDAGIETAAFFIVGYPGETITSIEKTFSFALTLPLDVISFNIPFPLPGSRLFSRVAGIDPNKDWNAENEVTFVFDSEFNQNWLRDRIEETMAKFIDKKNTISRHVAFSLDAISRA